MVKIRGAMSKLHGMVKLKHFQILVECFLFTNMIKCLIN